jgi:hypothetical protein
MLNVFRLRYKNNKRKIQRLVKILRLSEFSLQTVDGIKYSLALCCASCSMQEMSLAQEGA